MKRFSLVFLLFTIVATHCEAQPDHCNKRQVGTPSDANGWRGAFECTWAYGDNMAPRFLDRLEAEGKAICYRISEFEEGNRLVFSGDFPWKLWTVRYDYKCKTPISFTNPETKIAPDNQSNSEIQFKRSIEDSKTKCSELGFKSGTESFGKCVLQLTK